MSEFRVIEHVSDDEANVYRLTVGVVEKHAAAVLDKQGHPVRLPDEQARDENGEPIFLPGELTEVTDEETGETHFEQADPTPLMTPGAEMTEEVEIVVASEDFIWAKDDPRWNERTAESIARSQREDVKKVLAERQEAAAAKAATVRVDMPGIGRTI